MPGRPWCSLYDITGHFYDRNILIAELLIELFRSIARFEQHGFQSFSNEWHDFDYLFGNIIEISRPLGPLVGRANGVNEAGALILIDDKDDTHLISSGEASLHMK
jgi:BirA family biotin operon repressor/biotin-[acetyl-CoA-carboxylase] ligase